MEKYKILFGNRRLEACKKLGMKTVKAVDDDGKLIDLAINRIERKENVRTSHKDVAELMTSIKEHGLLQPIGVTKKATTKDFLLKNAIENVQRADISPIELGKVCAKLKKEEGMSEKEIAARLGIPFTQVNGALVVFNKIPKQFADSIGFKNQKGKSKEHIIPMAIAKSIATAKLSAKPTAEFFKAVKSRDLSLRQVDQIARMARRGISIKDALAQLDGTMYRSAHVFVNVANMRAMLKREGSRNFECLIRGVLRGEIEPDKKVFLE